MFMTPTNIVEIKRFICELKPKLSAGVDQILPIVLRYLPDNVLHALTYIFNQSLCEGKFISVFKQAKIMAVYKKGNQKNVLNYRPISLLSSVSKILEKVFTLDCIRLLTWIIISRIDSLDSGINIRPIMQQLCLFVTL